LYFGYMGLICFGLFLMTGFIGVFCSLWFNKVIFASIKID
jgi:transmembrane 9 superfamily member 2/4